MEASETNNPTEPPFCDLESHNTIATPSTVEIKAPKGIHCMLARREDGNGDTYAIKHNILGHYCDRGGCS